MSMKRPRQISVQLQVGFSLLELVLVCAILSIVTGAIVSGIQTTVQRSQAEQTKVDLTQEGREFVDEFERDLHQAGYPNCRTVAAPLLGATPNCPADDTNPTEEWNPAVAVGLVYLSNTKIIFEGAIDGSGTVYSVQYRLVDSNNNDPPNTTCPCTLQRSEMVKVAGPSLTQPVLWSQELQNVVNSGVPGGTTAYGGGLNISGGTYWGATNTAYYAAVSSFKDYPVFQARDQNGNIVPLPLSIAGGAGTPALTCAATSTSCVKSIRLTINLLASSTTGVDMQTHVRPVTTLVGDARLVNN